MKPNPLASLNHFTRPVSDIAEAPPFECTFHCAADAAATHRSSDGRRTLLMDLPSGRTEEERADQAQGGRGDREPNRRNPRPWNEKDDVGGGQAGRKAGP